MSHKQVIHTTLQNLGQTLFELILNDITISIIQYYFKTCIPIKEIYNILNEYLRVDRC